MFTHTRLNKPILCWIIVNRVTVVRSATGLMAVGSTFSQISLVVRTHARVSIRRQRAETAVELGIVRKADVQLRVGHTLRSWCVHGRGYRRETLYSPIDFVSTLYATLRHSEKDNRYTAYYDSVVTINAF